MSLQISYLQPLQLQMALGQHLYLTMTKEPHQLTVHEQRLLLSASTSATSSPSLHCTSPFSMSTSVVIWLRRAAKIFKQLGITNLITLTTEIYLFRTREKSSNVISCVSHERLPPLNIPNIKEACLSPAILNIGTLFLNHLLGTLIDPIRLATVCSFAFGVETAMFAEFPKEKCFVICGIKRFCHLRNIKTNNFFQCFCQISCASCCDFSMKTFLR